MGFGAALVIPMLDLITLQIPNAATLLFPAWFQATKGGGQGIEVMGQRLIFMIGQLVVFILALVPAVEFPEADHRDGQRLLHGRRLHAARCLRLRVRC